MCIPATILKDYECGLLYVKINANIYEFRKDEEYFMDPSSVVLLNKDQWRIMIEVCDKHFSSTNVEAESKNYDENDIGKKKYKIRKTKK